MREQESQRQTAGHFLEAGKTCFQGKLHWKVRASSQGCHEHRPPVQTLVLGLCEGQGMLHSHKIMLLPHGFSFPKRKEKLVSTQGCVLRCGYPREIRAWGGLHGRLQYSVSIAFTCSGKPKNSRNSLYCNICFTVIVWN